MRRVQRSMSDVKLELSEELLQALQMSGDIQNVDSCSSNRIDFSEDNKVILNGYDGKDKKNISFTFGKVSEKENKPVFVKEEVEDNYHKEKKRGSIINRILLVLGGLILIAGMWTVYFILRFS